MSAKARKTISISDDDFEPVSTREAAPRVSPGRGIGAGRGAFSGLGGRGGYEEPDAGRSRASETKAAQLHVGVGLTLEGQVRSCEELFVEGSLEGDIETEVLRIGAEGRIKGQAQASEAEINGTFDGDLTITGRLAVGATGCVTGKVVYGSLMVEDGGRLVGDLQHATVGERPGGRRRAGLGLGVGRRGNDIPRRAEQDDSAPAQTDTKRRT